MFCPRCKSLLIGKVVRGKPQRCPTCDPVDERAPKAWFTQSAGGPDRSSAAARVAAGARPHVPASGRAREAHPRDATKPRSAQAPPRRREEIPPPAKVELPPGADLFPFSGIRDGQREFLGDVAQAAELRKHLLAHAPTGLGKTVSTLAPLVAYALRHEKRVFFLTSKQSQHKIAVDTLKAIREKAGVPFVVADVIGKQDMCPRDEARDLFPKRFSEFCRRQQVQRECQYWENANSGALKILKQRVHHVEELVVECTDQTTCPHQAALDLAAQAHVVVCDYNYFFSDLRTQMQERLKLDLSDVILVVDEAHNLPDRIRDHLAQSLSDYVIDEAMGEVADLDDPALGKLIEALRDILRDLADRAVPRDPYDDRGDAGERYVEREEFVDAVNEAFGKRVTTLTATTYDGFVDDLDDALETYVERFKDDSRGLATLREFLSNWKVERRGVARILTREPTPTLHYKMLDPSVLARPVFDAVHASVVMSGTLHPMEMMRDVLGLDPARAVLREYASPFPRENRLALIDASVTTSYKERSPEMFREIGARLAEVAATTPGNVAAFFPSYAILEQVRPHAEAAVAGRKDVIAEERGLDKSQREALVARVRRSKGDAVLLAVQGGGLSEGYDYEDNLLKAVVIVGLPFAAPSLEVESLIGYYNKKFGPGLGRPYAYVHPTFHRVLQAAGRCIRSPDDKGVIVLMDKRFGWGTYQASYPADLRPAISHDVARSVADFWRRGRT